MIACYCIYLWMNFRKISDVLFLQGNEVEFADKTNLPGGIFETVGPKRGGFIKGLVPQCTSSSLTE